MVHHDFRHAETGNEVILVKNISTVW